MVPCSKFRDLADELQLSVEHKSVLFGVDLELPFIQRLCSNLLTTVRSRSSLDVLLSSANGPTAFLGGKSWEKKYT
jgi:hypothetical protein